MAEGSIDCSRARAESGFCSMRVSALAMAWSAWRFALLHAPSMAERRISRVKRRVVNMAVRDDWRDIYVYMADGARLKPGWLMFDMCVWGCKCTNKSA